MTIYTKRDKQLLKFNSKMSHEHLYTRTYTDD